MHDVPKLETSEGWLAFAAVTDTAVLLLSAGDNCLRAHSLAASDCLGWPLDQWNGRSLDALPAWVKSKPMPDFEKLAAQARSMIIDVAVADGAPRTVRLRAQRVGLADSEGILVLIEVVDAPGAPNSIGSEPQQSVAQQDVPTAAVTERALRESEQRFKAIFEHAGVGILVADAADGSLLSANPHMLDMLGCDTASLARARLAQVVTSTNGEQVGTIQARAGAGEQVELEGVACHRLDGVRFYADLSLTPIDEGRRRLLMIVFRDVTDRRLAEHARTAQLRYLESMRNLSDAMGRSHDATSLLENLARTLRRMFELDRAWVLHRDERQQEHWALGAEAARRNCTSAVATGDPLPDHPAVHETLDQALAQPGPTTGCGFAEGTPLRETLGVRAQMLIAVRPRFGQPWLLWLQDCVHDRVWTTAERRLLRDVAERIAEALGAVQLRHELRQSEERLKLALEGARDGVWDWDIRADERYLTPLWKGRLGLIHGERGFSYQEWLALIHPDDQPQVEQALRQHLDGATHDYHSEHRLRDADGHWIWVLDRGKVVERDADGHPQRAVGVYSDITDRKLVEKELRERHCAVESSLVGIVLADLQGRITYVNPALSQMWGAVDGELMLRRSTDSLFEPGQTALAALEASLTAGDDWSGELVARRIDVGLFDARVSVNWVRDDSGRAFSIMASCLDITELKRAEARLRESATVFESTSEGVLITDPDGCITAVNKAFTEITGYAESEALGRPASLLKSDRHGRAFFEQLWQSLAQAGHWHGEIWNRRKSGELFPALVNINTVWANDKRVSHYVSVFSDITVIKRSQNLLNHLAHHDALTGLPNRLLFNDRLQHALDRVQRHGGHTALLFMDLDRFKMVNDSFGHHTGDELLKSVSERLKNSIREQDTVARLGGDEFTVVAEDIEHAHDAAVLAQKIIDCFVKPFQVAGRDLYISTSIGISVYPDDGNNVATLVKNADAAMYRAKGLGRNNYQFYVSELTETAFERYMLETGLRRALDRTEFLVFYQPQYSAHTGALVAIEALLRWQHPEFGLLTPARFLSVAEETGLLKPMGDWALFEACRQWAAWRDAGLQVPRLAVNLCAAQISRGNLVETVRDTIRGTGIDPLALELEITEGFIMDQVQEAIEAMETLRRMGITLSIDDFGTGYSSLSYLKRLPIHRLKIDQSFVRDIPHDPDDEAIARAVIALGRSLQMTVIAEGVETEAQRSFLREEGCDLLQGNLLSEPLSAQALEAVLERQTVAQRSASAH